jgi:tetratricopeptide (TPR) repeat protein/ankyrin repeat protein
MAAADDMAADEAAAIATLALRSGDASLAMGALIAAARCRAADLRAFRDARGASLLHLAAATAGAEHTAALFLTLGIEAAAATRDGLQPAHCAALWGPWRDRGRLQQLLFLRAKTCEEAVMCATGDAGALIEAVAGKPHVARMRDEAGWALVHWAAACGSEACVRALLAAGADKDVGDHQGATPLAFAARRGHAACALALLEAGADANAGDVAGRTPLHWACAADGSCELVAALLRGDADANARDRGGQTPLHWAAKLANAAAVRVLLAHGAKRAARDIEGRMPRVLASCEEVAAAFGASAGEEEEADEKRRDEIAAAAAKDEQKPGLIEPDDAEAVAAWLGVHFRREFLASPHWRAPPRGRGLFSRVLEDETEFERLASVFAAAWRDYFERAVPAAAQRVDSIFMRRSNAKVADALHSEGVRMRHLALVAEYCTYMPARTLVAREARARACKHLVGVVRARQPSFWSGEWGALTALVLRDAKGSRESLLLQGAHIMEAVRLRFVQGEALFDDIQWRDEPVSLNFAGDMAEVIVADWARRLSPAEADRYYGERDRVFTRLGDRGPIAVDSLVQWLRLYVDCHPPAKWGLQDKVGAELTHRLEAACERGELPGGVLGRAEATLGLIRVRCDDFVAALVHFDRSLEAFKGSEREADRAAATWTLACKAKALYVLQRYAAALELMRPVIPLLEKQFGAEDIRVIELCEMSGSALFETGDLAAAETATSIAVQRRSKLFGEMHESISTPLVLAGRIRERRGNGRGALQCFDMAMRILAAAHGAEHESIASLLEIVGECLARLGRLTDAIKQFRRQLDIATKCFEASDLRVSDAHHHLGSALLEVRKFEESLPHFIEARRVRLERLGPDNFFTASASRAIGEALLGLGRREEGLKELFSAAEALDKAGQRGGNEAARCHIVLAEALREQRRYEEALEHARLCLKLSIETAGPQSQQAASAHKTIGDTFQQAGKLDEAIEAYQQALQAIGSGDETSAAALLFKCGVAQRLARQNAQALETLGKCEAVSAKVYGPESLQVSLARLQSAYALVGDRRFDDARRLLTRCTSRLSALYSEDPEALVRVHDEIAAVWMKVRCIDDALHHRKQSLATAALFADRKPVALAIQMKLLVETLRAACKYGEAEQVLRDLLKLAEERLGSHPSLREEALASLGGVLLDIGRFRDAANTFRDCLALAVKRVGTEEDFFVTELKVSLGNALSLVGEFAEARDLTQQSLEMRIKLLGASDVDVAMCMCSLAFNSQMSGRFSEAREQLKRPREIIEEKKATATSCYLYVLNVATGTCVDLGLHDEALQHCEELLPLAARLHGAESEQVARALLSKALALLELARFDEALQQLARARDINNRLLDPWHPGHGYALVATGRALLAKGRAAEALTMFESAERVWARALGRDDRRYAYALCECAAALDALGRREEALAQFEEALRIRRAQLGDEHPETLDAIYKLGLAHLRRENKGEALRLLRQSLVLREARLGAEHVETARSAAAVARASDDAQEREQLLRRARAALERALGAAHPDVLALN